MRSKIKAAVHGTNYKNVIKTKNHDDYNNPYCNNSFILNFFSLFFCIRANDQSEQHNISQPSYQIFNTLMKKIQSAAIRN